MCYINVKTIFMFINKSRMLQRPEIEDKHTAWHNLPQDYGL
jgi:hypothetical protein